MNIGNISIGGYGNYSSDNYGRNCMKVEIGALTLWFSYNTAIAFRHKGEFHIIKNYWSTTTGKHLNWVDDNKKIRETREVFEANLNKALKECGL